LPRQSDQTSDSHTLPPADLNPLINPLLAENMGRWAEVYFTSPPESREQAVLELLRELEEDKSRREAALKASESSEEAFLARCQKCGHENPPSHRFCGMCGGPMVGEDLDAGEHSLHRLTPAGSERAPNETDQHWDQQPRSYDDSPAPRHELSLFQAYRESDSDARIDDWSYEPSPSSSYRGYVGAVLAILIVGLGYMAWRGMQNSQGHEASPAPPIATKETETSQTQPPAPKSEAAHDFPSASVPASTPTAKAPPEESPKTTAEAAPAAAENKVNRTEPPAPEPSKSVRTVPKTENESVPAAQPQASSDKWGAEELAVAQRYLNGSNGQRRDSAEAAKWLWKSIAKHNSQATLLLADLYLKGDGVSKNCDQARILLDSAARKGLSGAGERLRNLQAFGCQ
jgi:hypothetical protein